MKRRHYNVIWAMVCYALLSFTGIAQAQDDTLAAADTSAKGVVTQYFTALEQGDTAGIRNLLGGELLQSRSRLLSNPTYPDTLQAWYQGASFSITNTSVVDASRVTVEVQVVWSDDRQTRYRFLLEKDPKGVFLIHVEDEVM